MKHYSKKVVKKGTCFIRCLFYSGIIIILILLFSFSIKANSVELFYRGLVENNKISLRNMNSYYLSGDFTQLLNNTRIKDTGVLKHYENINYGMAFNLGNLTLRYSSINNGTLSTSKSAVELINRINNFNWKNNFEDVLIDSYKIDLTQLKLLYQSNEKEIFNKEAKFLFGFNYYEGKNIKYRDHDLDIEIDFHDNYLYDEPLIVKGNLKDYYNINQNNYGFSFDFGTMLLMKEDMKIKLLFEDIFGFVKWNSLQHDDGYIDTETIYLDEDENINFAPLITGKRSWLDYKMKLPLKINFYIEKKINNFLLSSHLHWQEFLLGDFSGKEFLSVKPRIGYYFKESLISLGYDTAYEVYDFSFKNNSLFLNVYADGFQFSKINKAGIEISYNHEF